MTTSVLALFDHSTTNKEEMGTYLFSFAYYSTGELKTQTDAKGQVIAFQYDTLGRMINRTDTCGVGSTADGCSSGTLKSNVTWTYDNAPNGLGRLTVSTFGCR